MAEKDKIFYWLKLKSEFMNGEIVDFLMSQKNGANYVVLYQMLCIKTINTKGELATQLGDILVPYNVEKIQRDLKWFDIDTVRVALELYKKLGLVYVQENGIIKISNFEETPRRERKQWFRRWSGVKSSFFPWSIPSEGRGLVPA